jgi:hypothetical protein
MATKFFGPADQRFARISEVQRLHLAEPGKAVAGQDSGRISPQLGKSMLPTGPGTSAASMRRLVIVKLFPSLTGFASAVHSSRCFYPHSDEPQWARCILVSDDDEWVLLSEARPRRAKPLVAVTETRDGNESGKVLTSVLLMLAYGLLFNS